MIRIEYLSNNPIQSTQEVVEAVSNAFRDTFDELKVEVKENLWLKDKIPMIRLALSEVVLLGLVLNDPETLLKRALQNHDPTLS